MKNYLAIAIEAAVLAGREVMKYYSAEEIEMEIKSDNSPLTIADKSSNEIINRFLEPTGIPIISEENEQIPFEQRKKWEMCWIVDPLDGTKEFLNRNGEFTVNIALVSLGKPILGVIYAPALDYLYFGDISTAKAFKASENLSNFNVQKVIDSATEIAPSMGGDCIRIVGSRSHMNDRTVEYIQSLKKESGKEIKLISKGSSLKFCLVAEGEAEIYPRFAPTMEWDTAAGQAICETVGLSCTSIRTGNPIKYNREDLLNGHFLVSNGR